jgi:hypothetical protein
VVGSLRAATRLVIRPTISAVLALHEGHVGTGDRDRAHARASEGLALSQAEGARGGEARARRLLGEIAATADPSDCEHAEGVYGHG